VIVENLVSTVSADPSKPSARGLELDFEQVYAQEFAFVWRNLRHHGVGEEGLRDAAQDVFLVVHRRLAQFEGHSPLRSWLYSILKRVASQYRRTDRRKRLRDTEEADAVADTQGVTPEKQVERREALRLLQRLLDDLDEDKRDAFVLAELEGMTAPEIAELLVTNVNTIYARLRAAREQLRTALRAFHARGRCHE